ncbi:MAG TPA: hypothetical protein VHC43_05215 [Mycobacteriales bacterium]|nr:hypothetical protein [Mycobacteriales bacterium]
MTLAGLVIVPIVFVGPSVAPSTAHLASSSRTAPVALGTEAWYSSPQICVIPQVCLPIRSPITTTYPVHTLHIAAAGGNESARTYLELREPIAPTTVVTGGVLRLPLDTSPADGSVAPDLAKVEACTTRTPIKAVEGSTAKPPATDCRNAPTSRVIGTPASELDIDLGPIGSRLQHPGTGLALLPVLSPAATWDVTLSSNLRAKSSATTPVLILTTRDELPQSSTTATPPESASRRQSATGDEPLIPAGPVDVEPQTSEVPGAAVSAPQIAPTRPTAFKVGRHGFDYPVVFLTPLLILAGLIAFGRQLTRPLTRQPGS